MQMLVGILTGCLKGMKLSQNTLSIANVCVSVSYLNPITSSSPTSLYNVQSVYNVMTDSD